jgi:biopolymer transport protein TolQ
MTEHTSLLTFILNAGLVVKMVMLILVLASVFSWMFIFQRFTVYTKIKNAMREFEKQFNSGISLPDLLQDSQSRSHRFAMRKVFLAGYQEFQRLQTRSDIPAQAKLDNIDRAMRININRTIDKLQQNLNYLATVGSVSPYIGLFGTVWGIMTAFSSLGSVQQATIAMVAPGISEALIATAFGLFAAIPAVIAFNRFTNSMNQIGNQLDTFADEILKVLYQDLHA